MLKELVGHGRKPPSGANKDYLLVPDDWRPDLYLVEKLEIVFRITVDHFVVGVNAYAVRLFRYAQHHFLGTAFSASLDVMSFENQRLRQLVVFQFPVGCREYSDIYPRL